MRFFHLLVLLFFSFEEARSNEDYLLTNVDAVKPEWVGKWISLEEKNSIVIKKSGYFFYNFIVEDAFSTDEKKFSGYGRFEQKKII